MTAVKKSDWKVESSFPSSIEYIPYKKIFNDLDAKKLTQGFIPKSMDDKWFVFFEDYWLYFVRSWTGYYIFAIEFEGSPAGVRVKSCWVNRDNSQYKSANINLEVERLDDLIKWLLYID